MTAARVEREPTILLVDDEPLLRTLTARILRQGGYNVIEAEDGVEALAHCAGTGLIDLVVTDVRMPRMNGIDLALGCREHRPAVPFLFMSGDLNVAETIGPFLPKPFRAEKLAAAVRQLLTEAGLGL